MKIFKTTNDTCIVGPRLFEHSIVSNYLVQHRNQSNSVRELYQCDETSLIDMWASNNEFMHEHFDAFGAFRYESEVVRGTIRM